MMGLLLGCLGPAADDSPVAMYDQVYEDFRAHYALFPVKELSWDALYEEHLGLTETSSARDLHEALTGLMGPLDDNHVHLLATDSISPSESFPDWTSGVLEDLEQEDFALEVTLELLDESEQPDPMLAWGRAGELGYVWIGSMSDAAVLEHLDAALDALEDSEGLVLDVRGNGGGYDAVTQAMAGRFIDDDRLYGRQRLRSGPYPDLDYTDWSPLRVAEVDGPAWEGPMVVLQHRFTVSAAEGFLLAMGERSETSFIGEVSSGAFGTIWWRELANGWLYSMTVTDVRDNFEASWEGIGLPVDVQAKSTLEELQAGEDKALEAAIEALQ